MQPILPPLRALQAFESFGRLGSVSAAAQELGVTPGAISQQIKVLEEQLNMPLLVKDGRRAALAENIRAYHAVLSSGFDKLKQGQTLLAQQERSGDVHVSGLPTLILKWLNPRLHKFEARHGYAPIRLEATHIEPDPQFLNHMFRLTYGAASDLYPHFRPLFRDECFPVCSPGFLEVHPEVMDPKGLAKQPWVDIDWGPGYEAIPHLPDWLLTQGVEHANSNPASIHSVSSSALEFAAAGHGVALAQSSFAQFDLEIGRLVRLSQNSIPMPESYFICWGGSMMDSERARDFLEWILSEVCD